MTLKDETELFRFKVKLKNMTQKANKLQQEVDSYRRAIRIIQTHSKNETINAIARDLIERKFNGY